MIMHADGKSIYAGRIEASGANIFKRKERIYFLFPTSTLINLESIQKATTSIKNDLHEEYRISLCCLSGLCCDGGRNRCSGKYTTIHFLLNRRICILPTRNLTFISY